MLIRPILILLFGLFIQKALSQDGHYWTQQYGTRSMLLSNSVVGGVDDLSAVYYNPGRLAVISNSAFLLSANVYEYNAISIDNAFGNSKNASKSSIKGVPTLAAGTFKLKFLPKHFFAYAILTRQSSDLDFGFKNEQYQDVIAALPGKEYFGAEVAYQQSSNEQWIGVTWSYSVTPKISVGVTTNYSTNSQSKSAKIDLQALAESNDVALYQYERSFGFKQSGLLWKVGLAAEVAQWQLGASVTTPIVNLSGSGNYKYEEFFSSVPVLGKTEIYSTSYQDGLNLIYRTPWSIGMGASRKIGRNKIHISTEWYSKVPQYTLMTAANHVSQSNKTDTIRFILKDQLNSVWNFGLGTELYISEQVSGFASFSTDFSAISGNITRFSQRQPEANNSGWNTDFYHFGFGFVLKLKGADITLGATRTGGNLTLSRPVNFPENPNQPIFSGTDQADANWQRWRLVFSFSFPFLKDIAKKYSPTDK